MASGGRTMRSSVESAGRPGGRSSEVGVVCSQSSSVVRSTPSDSQIATRASPRYRRSSASSRTGSSLTDATICRAVESYRDHQVATTEFMRCFKSFVEFERSGAKPSRAVVRTHRTSLCSSASAGVRAATAKAASAAPRDAKARPEPAPPTAAPLPVIEKFIARGARSRRVRRLLCGRAHGAPNRGVTP